MKKFEDEVFATREEAEARIAELIELADMEGEGGDPVAAQVLLDEVARIRATWPTPPGRT